MAAAKKTITKRAKRKYVRKAKTTRRAKKKTTGPIYVDKAQITQPGEKESVDVIIARALPPNRRNTVSYVTKGDRIVLLCGERLLAGIEVV